MKNKDLYQIITNKIIEKLENGTIPWKRPYSDSNYPVNWVTQKMYRGINLMLLEGGEYATFNQIKNAGGKVKKGEKAEIVVFYKKIKIEDKETGEEKEIPMLKEYKVFEINTQVEGLKSKRDMINKDNQTIEKAEKIVTDYFSRKSAPSLKEKKGVPCYIPKFDIVCMPNISDFTNSELYYSTVFHEMVHSTGHKDRLNREGVTGEISFGSKTYSNEELIAEIGASILSAHANIDNETLENSASYIDSWLKKLKNDKKFIVSASQKAQKGTDLILDIKF